MDTSLEDVSVDRYRPLWACVASVLLLAAFVVASGCDGSGRTDSASAPSADTASAEVLQRLADADAADGAVDKVIRKCVTCSLHMDGDAAHAATVHGYEAHLCSEQCLLRFQSDPDRALLSMNPAQ